MAELKTASSLHVLLIDFEFFAYSAQLAMALSDLCRVTLLLPDKTPHELVERVREAVDVCQFHMPRLRYPTNVGMLYNVIQTISRTKPQVIHQLAWNLWMNMALPILPDIPMVATIHDAQRHPGDRQSVMLLQGWQCRRAKQLIVHAEVIKRQLVHRYHLVEDKVNVIRLGAYDLYRTWGSDKGSEQGNTILFFGRIWEYKGLRYLIEAEPLITAQIPDARIVIAGYGEPFEKYERLMVNKDRFVVHNYHIPERMVSSLFQEASVVVLPYTEASQSAVLATAYAFGKPVVVTAVGGIPEVVEEGETGFLVPPRDAPSLAQAVVRLLQDPSLRDEMGAKALERARSDLSWASIARRTVDVYRKAIAGSV